MPQPLDVIDINVGQDVSVVFTTQSGQIIRGDQLGLVMKFNAKLETTKLKVKPISHGGQTFRRSIPDGWVGSIGFSRVNGNITNLAAALANQFHDVGTLTIFSLSVTVKNRDGTIDEYLFTGCCLSDFDFGTFEADKEVEQSIDFEAQRMKVVGGASVI